jgi:hypothetical protein
VEIWADSSGSDKPNTLDDARRTTHFTSRAEPNRSIPPPAG